MAKMSIVGSDPMSYYYNHSMSTHLYTPLFWIALLVANRWRYIHPTQSRDSIDKFLTKQNHVSNINVRKMTVGHVNKMSYFSKFSVIVFHMLL